MFKELWAKFPLVNRPVRYIQPEVVTGIQAIHRNTKDKYEYLFYMNFDKRNYPRHIHLEKGAVGATVPHMFKHYEVLGHTHPIEFTREQHKLYPILRYSDYSTKYPSSADIVNILFTTPAMLITRAPRKNNVSVQTTTGLLLGSDRKLHSFRVVDKNRVKVKIAELRQDPKLAKQRYTQLINTDIEKNLQAAVIVATRKNSPVLYDDYVKNFLRREYGVELKDISVTPQGYPVDITKDKRVPVKQNLRNRWIDYTDKENTKHFQQRAAHVERITKNHGSVGITQNVVNSFKDTYKTNPEYVIDDQLLSWKRKQVK